MIKKDDSLPITPSELRRLRCGSYESRIEDAAAGAREHFGDVPFEIIATRENGVVVLSEGRCQLIAVEGGDTLAEDLNVDMRSLSSMKQEARNIVDLFLNGSSRAAVCRLEELVPTAPSIMKMVEMAVNEDRPWHSLFSDRQEHIKSFIGEDGASDQLRQKFGRLYDESIDDSAQEDLESVVDRLAVLKNSVESSLGSVEELLGEATDPVLEQFRFFAEDLLDDLRLLHEESSNAMTAIDGFYDHEVLSSIIVRGLSDREAASRFVVAAASEMIEAT